MRLSFLLAMALCGPAMAAADNVRSLNIVNSADTPIVALATATQGSPWQPLALRTGALRKGGAVDLDLGADDRCSRDFRVVFADARALVLRDFDTCRAASFDPAFYLPRMHRQHVQVRAGKAES